MLEAIIDFYTKFADFGGRTGLRFYRLAVTYNAVVTAILIFAGPTILRDLIFTNSQGFLWYLALPGSWILIHFIPLLALQARRMHDLGLPGYTVLVPGAGIKMFWQKSTPGDNQYGPEPKDL